MNICSYKGYSLLSMEDSSGSLGIVSGWMEVLTLGDCSRYYVVVRICWAVSLEKIYISLVGMPIRSLDAYEQGVVFFM